MEAERGLTLQYKINSRFNSISYMLGKILVDPGDIWEGFGDIKFALLTHAHFDHIYGLNKLTEMNQEVQVFTNEYGREMLLNTKKNMSYYNETPFIFDHPEKIVTVTDGEELYLGDDLTAKTMFTPGHNPSCITWMIGEKIFTGDSYIPGIKTVTNLPGSNKKEAEQSERKIIELANAGKEVCAGHFID